MADWSGALSKRCGFGEDFQEEDVWNSVKEREDSSDFIIRKSTDYCYSSSSSSSWRLPTAPRMIPKAISRTNETQVANRSSVPMDIPDWSKIYGKTGSSVDNRFGVKNDDRDHYGGDEEDNDGEVDDMVPPHEWIAQKLARSRISSFSVCEGIGRTLKGRDLSEVRNAILTKTGFLE